MTPRRFSLQAVLELRSQAKEQAEAALRFALQAWEAAAQKCADAETQLSQIAGHIGGERFTASSRNQTWNALCAHQDLCLNLKQQEAEEQNRLLSARSNLVQTTCDHELVVRLKEKWRKTRAQEQARIEERQLEEFVSAARHIQSHRS